MLISRLRSSLLTLTLVLAFCAALLPTQAHAQPNPPGKPIFLPMLVRQGVGPLVEVAWRWGHVGQATGSRGLRVADWDGDGKPEILTANELALVVLRHAGNYQFDQVWAAPPGVGWALVPLPEPAPPAPTPRLWILDEYGRLRGYHPSRFAAVVEKTLTLGAGDKIRQAEFVELTAKGNWVWLALVQRADYVYELRTFTAAGGGPTWSYVLGKRDLYGPEISFVTGQFDADAQREIAVNTGPVIDPVQSAPQWTLADGFIHGVAADIDGDGLDELTYTRAYPFELRVMDVDKGVQKWSYRFEDTTEVYHAIGVLDVDADGTPEVITGSEYSLKVRSNTTGAYRWSISGGADTNAISGGDIDGDGQFDLVWGSGDGQNGPSLLQAAPAKSTKVQFLAPGYEGPFSPLPLALHGALPLDLVIFTVGTETAYYSHGDSTNFVVNSVTGATEAGMPLPLPGIPMNQQFDAPPGGLLQNFDADPALEAVVLQHNLWDVGGLYIFDDNGALIRQTPVSQFGERAPKLVWTGDLDGDGQAEIVVRLDWCIVVYDSQTLTVEWDSRETYTGRADEAAIGDVDRDGVQEILIAGGDHDHPLRRINAITHAVEWDAPAGVSYTGVAVGEANGLRGPEIATVEDGRLTLHDGVTFQVLARTLDMGQQPVQHLLFVRMANAPAAQLVLATQQNVYLFRNPLDATPVQVIDLNPVVSYNYNQPHLAFADVDGDHHLDMLIGDGSGVARYRVIDLLPD